jgi:hypothetical protein
VSFLLDTNVVSEVRRKQPDPLVLSWLENVDPGALHISVLTLGEIAKGAAKRAARERLQADALDRWLQSIRLHYADRVVGIDATIAERWGRLTAVRTLPVQVDVDTDCRVKPGKDDRWRYSAARRTSGAAAFTSAST